MPLGPAADPRTVTLSGWGGAPRSVAELIAPASASATAAAVREPGPRGAIARGLGRGYGDAAQCAGGTVLDCTAIDDIGAIDATDGTITLGAGVSIDTLLRTIVPLGWFAPVTPGTRFVTIGGAVAADVHGKNHHRDGAFGSWVQALSLATSDGETRRLTPTDTPEPFWATVGGMGLTGVITEATVRLIPIETDRLLVDTERATDLDDLMARMESGDADYRYSVAWVDLASRGRGFGRGVLTRGDHAPAEALPPTAREAPRRFAARTLATVPPWVPSGLVRRETVRIFNELYFRRAPAHRAGELLGIAPFFYPLDIAGQWNRLYGPAGFLQYQCVVPFGREETLTRIARTINESRNVASLVVLKRFGAADPAPLSFPIPGWTLAVDFPLPGDGLGVLLDGLDELVADAGGRLYLAKDSRLRPELVPAMYPRLDEWRRTRAAMDPAGTMQSDLSRRLRLL